MRLEHYTSQPSKGQCRRIDWSEFRAALSGLHVYLFTVVMVGAVWLSAWAQSSEIKRRNIVYFPALPMPLRKAAAAGGPPARPAHAVIADVTPVDP